MDISNHDNFQVPPHFEHIYINVWVVFNPKLNFRTNKIRSFVARPSPQNLCSRESPQKRQSPTSSTKSSKSIFSDRHLEIENIGKSSETEQAVASVVVVVALAAVIVVVVDVVVALAAVVAVDVVVTVVDVVTVVPVVADVCLSCQFI